MSVNFAERRKEAEKAGLLGSGDYLKLKEGANRFRLMTECLPHESTYQGKKTFKWLCYVVDRADGKVKPFFMPHTIYKQIESLQFSEDYPFNDVPMPYDLTVNALKAGTMDVEYSLMPARKETIVTPLEHQALADVQPLAELQKALKAKAATQPEHQANPRASRQSDVAHDAPPLTDDDIPFMWLLPLMVPFIGLLGVVLA